MFRPFVVRFMFRVEYQTCSEVYVDRARKISALVYFSIESYAVCTPVLSGVQAAICRTGEMQFFELVNIEIFSCVEYQSWAKCCDDHTHQNSACLHEGNESYEKIGKCRSAVRTARRIFAI
jgi:hypothetical protein